MPMSVRNPHDDDLARETIRTAVEAGITFIDTADAYCQSEDEFGHNEVLIADALRDLGADHVVVATKGGHTRVGTSWQQDGSPEYLARACRDSLKRLGTDQIALYQFHRPDPRVAYEDSVGAIKDLHDEGLIARAGISNADPDQIRLAHAILGDALVSVQNQYSPSFRSSEPEIDVCDELGLAFLPWSPLGGMGGAGDLGGRHTAFARVADDHGVSPQQVALAWELARSPRMLPIPGASRPASIADCAAAADLVLSDAQIAALT
jgi:aryl-alcohol dehydrogenase-like predicted oxidoreductase